MTLEEYLIRSRLVRRLKSGPHGPLVELDAARLGKDGLAAHGVWRSSSASGPRWTDPRLDRPDGIMPVTNHAHPAPPRRRRTAPSIRHYRRRYRSVSPA